MQPIETVDEWAQMLIQGKKKDFKADTMNIFKELKKTMCEKLKVSMITT